MIYFAVTLLVFLLALDLFIGYRLGQEHEGMNKSRAIRVGLDPYVIPRGEFAGALISPIILYREMDCGTIVDGRCKRTRWKVALG